MSDYFVKRATTGKIVGPVSGKKLKALAKQGGLQTSDEISKSETGPWQAARTVKGLDVILIESQDPSFDEPQEVEAAEEQGTDFAETVSAPQQGASPPAPSKTVVCEDCGGTVSRRADACPHCGCPVGQDQHAEAEDADVFDDVFDDVFETDENEPEIFDYSAEEYETSYSTPVSSGGKKSAKRVSSKRRLPVWVKVCLGVGVGVFAVTGLCVFSFLGLSRQSYVAEQQLHCSTQLKALTVALYVYHDTYGSLPPAYIPDVTDKPMHSWRTLLLPFLGDNDADLYTTNPNEIYINYDFSQPWDSPANKLVSTKVPSCQLPGRQHGAFSCAANPNAFNGNTDYLLLTGPGTCFDGGTAVKLSDIDRPENTIVVVEVSDSGIHWAEPRDYNVTSFLRDAKSGKLSSPHGKSFHVGFADGSVRLLDPNSVDLESLTKRAAGDK